MFESDVSEAARALKVVDFGLGMSAALVAKQLAEMGAAVNRIEPATGDPFHEVYPAYRHWRSGARNCLPAQADELLRVADICIIGGEDFPGVEPGRDAHALHRDYPDLIILQVSGYAGDHSRGRPAVDLLVQARTGVVWEQFTERPVSAGWPLPSYGAALQGLLGLWVALIARERGAGGQVVDVSMSAGAATFWGPFWMDVERKDQDFINLTPRDVRQLILCCRDGQQIHITLGVQGALARLYAVLGIPGPVDAHDRGLPDRARGPENFYGDLDLFNAYAANHRQDALLEALREAGIPAERVNMPGECWDDAQVKHNGIIVTHPDGWQTVASPLGFAAVGGAPLAAPARWRTMVDSDGPPLQGIRIFDFGIFVAGPYVSKLLANYGAEVIRVDAPSGSPTLSGTRTVISANYGKKSVFLDAKSEHGREWIGRLCGDADVVISNFRPGVAKRLGLDPESLRKGNPSLISMEVSAYGATGPDAGMPGFDMVIQARTGMEARAGGRGNGPMCSRTPVTDFATATFGAIGVLVALYERLKTGRSLDVRTSLLDVGIHMMLEVVRRPDGGLVGGQSSDSDQSGFHPAECIYRCRDGWIAVAARSESMAAALATALGMEPPRARADWDDAERADISACLASRSCAAVVHALEEAGVWVEVCRHDPWRNRDVDDVVFSAFEDERYGAVRHCLDSQVRFSRSRVCTSDRLQVPIGGDTREVLDKGWQTWVAPVPADDRRQSSGDELANTADSS